MTATTRPTPLFVLGFQRSGTTGIANMLAAHPRVAAVEAEDHGGVHESIFFSHFARAYGDASSDRDRERFVADFTSSDYYLLTGLDPEWLRQRRFRSYGEAFGLVMDEVARRRGEAAFWLEKSPHHTLFTDAIRAGLPDCRFVGVLRRAQENIRSWLWMDGATPPPYPARALKILRLALNWSLYSRTLRALDRADRHTLVVSFETFAADPEAVMRRICEFLSVDFDAGMLGPRYPKNTSFGPERPRSELALPALDRVLIHLFTMLAGLVPAAVIRALRGRAERRRGLDWPPWCWKRRDAGAAGGEAASPP